VEWGVTVTTGLEHHALPLARETEDPAGTAHAYLACQPRGLDVPRDVAHRVDAVEVIPERHANQSSCPPVDESFARDKATSMTSDGTLNPDVEERHESELQAAPALKARHDDLTAFGLQLK